MGGLGWGLVVGGGRGDTANGCGGGDNDATEAGMDDL